jgi:hypothetical protein
MSDITYPPEMLPSPDEDNDAEVIVDGKVIWSTGMSDFYIKKPIPIEAYRFDPAQKADYITNLEYADGGKGVDCRWGIRTLEGMMEVRIGDWIITGVRGEHYPIKGDIFEETYELAPLPSPPGTA